MRVRRPSPTTSDPEPVPHLDIWLLAKEDVVVIPKTGRRERLKENLGALKDPLTSAQLAELDRLFPRPAGPRPLEML